MSGRRALVGAYRALLNLYPREFRRAFGDDMVQLVHDQCGDESSLRVGARVILDLAITVPSQHVESRTSRRPTHLVAMIYSAMAAAGLLLAIVAGSNVAMFAGGLCVAALAAATAAAAWKRSGPIDDRTPTDAWWKFVLAGPCIVATVIVAAGLGVEAWEIGVLAVLTAFVLTGTGVLLGIARIAGRHSRVVST
jgi:hypothetical protein